MTLRGWQGLFFPGKRCGRPEKHRVYCNTARGAVGTKGLPPKLAKI
jgi:hypothetical protein